MGSVGPDTRFLFGWYHLQRWRSAFTLDNLIKFVSSVFAVEVHAVPFVLFLRHKPCNWRCKDLPDCLKCITLFGVCNLLSLVHPRQNLLHNYGSEWRLECHNAGLWMNLIGIFQNFVENTLQYLFHISIVTIIRNDHFNHRFNCLWGDK